MPRLVALRPLRVDDADRMADVLASPTLYAFTGGEPPTVDELRRRYAIQTKGGSSDGSEEWINLIVTLGPACQPVGFVQATIPTGSGPAEVAWVIGAPWQGRGLATSAAALLLATLEERGVRGVVAHIHPEHRSSQRVAEKLGLVQTDVVVDGEIRWVS